MALPPQQILRKRLRIDEPIDLLYIQHGKRVATEYGFRRVTSHGTPDLPYVSTQPQPSQRHVQAIDDSSKFGPRVPTVRATLPGEEDKTQEHAEHQRSVAQATSRHGSQLGISKDGVSIGGTFVEARQFRLARSVLSLTPRREPSFGGIQKRTHRKNEVAVFVEEKKRNKRRSPQLRSPYIKENEHMRGEHENHKADAALPTGRTKASIPREKPNRSALKYQPKVNGQNKLGILQGAEHPMTNPRKTVKEPSDRWDYDSTELAQELQQISLQAYQDYQVAGSGDVALARPTNTVSGVLSRHGSQRSETSNSTSATDDNNEDFVYDTYVRYDRHPLLGTTLKPESTLKNFSHELDVNNVGILNITSQEDQDLWDQFADDQESEKDWNSEEEDENAEDFYGNDYPEEDIDSEDEMGRGSYDHRKVASDDEEYDEDVDAWSDNDEDVHPWKHSMAQHTTVDLRSSEIS